VAVGRRRRRQLRRERRRHRLVDDGGRQRLADHPDALADLAPRHTGISLLCQPGRTTADGDKPRAGVGLDDGAGAGGGDRAAGLGAGPRGGGGGGPTTAGGGPPRPWPLSPFSSLSLPRAGTASTREATVRRAKAVGLTGVSSCQDP